MHKSDPALIYNTFTGTQDKKFKNEILSNGASQRMLHRASLAANKPLYSIAKTFLYGFTFFLVSSTLQPNTIENPAKAINSNGMLP